jgi:hypothetical protein
MKMTPDDPALTAYVLGELGETESTELNRALKYDENLLKEKEALAALSGLLADILGAGSYSLGEERIAEIHKAGQLPDSNILVLENRRRSRRQSFLAVGGVAAVVLTGFVALSQFDVGQPKMGVDGNGGRVTEESTPAGRAENLPGEVVIRSAEGVAIPLGISKADPSFVEKALLENGQLPERERFKIADWVNLSVVEFEPLVVMTDLEGYFESGLCPWDSTKSLWMVSLRSANGHTISPATKLVFDPEFVESAYLVGGGGTRGNRPVKSGEFNSSQIFLYELEIKKEGGQLGSFSISADHDESGYVPIYGPQRIQENPTVGFRAAVVLGGFARWAASDSREKETLVLLAREARELMALKEVTDESCRYALDVILQSEETLNR